MRTRGNHFGSHARPYASLGASCSSCGQETCSGEGATDQPPLHSCFQAATGCGHPCIPAPVVTVPPDTLQPSYLLVLCFSLAACSPSAARAADTSLSSRARASRIVLILASCPLLGWEYSDSYSAAGRWSRNTCKRLRERASAVTFSTPATCSIVKWI